MIEPVHVGPVVGVLAVHGAVAEQMDAVARAGGVARRVGSVADLESVDALVIPGGESTTVRLAAGDDLIQALRRCVSGGLPVLGTCAGLIALADHILSGDEPIVGGLDVTVDRNGYGRQIASFEAPLLYEPSWEGPADPDGVFIRAPRITARGPQVEVVARCRGDVVAVRQGEIIGAAYHPELTDDLRLHAWIVDRARAYHHATHS